MEENKMVDYSEAFLQMDRSLHDVYKLMLKDRKQKAAETLRELAKIANATADWIDYESH
jgi:hypothetical protein